VIKFCLRHLDDIPSSVVPRCRHGAIILGCPVPDCPEQQAYLERQQAALDAWYERNRFPPVDL
jgi:hypothetical protein